MSIGMTQMTSLLSSANTLKSVNNLNTSRTLMNGQSRILSAEIETDKGRGVDTKKKEERLTQTEERLQGIEENIAGTLTELNERIEADREKIREEEAEQARQAEKAAEKKAEAPSVSTPNGDANTSAAVSDITNPVDTVEISTESKAAASTETTVHVSAGTPVPTPSTGTVVDKKV